jgi:hypothetical protein
VYNLVNVPLISILIHQIIWFQFFAAPNSLALLFLDIGFESVYFFMHICFESSAIITNKSPNITKIIIFEKNMLKFKAGRKIQLLNINVWLRLPSKLVQILFLKLWCKQNQFSKLNFGLKNSIPHNQKHSILH